MNTNTIRIHYDDSYEREKQRRCFPQRSKIKVAHVCSLKPALDTHRQSSADLYRRTPCDRYICRRRVFSIRRAHGAPLESIRLRFVFLFSFFLFHFGGRLVVSSFSRRPTERKPKRERGVVLHGDESNLIALRLDTKVSVSVSTRVVVFRCCCSRR